MDFPSWYCSFELFIEGIKDKYYCRFWRHDSIEEHAEYGFDVEILSVIPISDEDFMLVVRKIEDDTLSLHRLSDLLTDLGCTLIPKNTEELEED